MADDLSVVNSAKVSFAKKSTEMDDAGKGLIKFLMRERHGTPFEHNAFRFHIKCPIFVAREWQRHRIGSFNEQSGRYTEFEAEFYIPTFDYCRSQIGKPGAYSFEPLPEPLARRNQSIMIESSKEAFETYKHLLSEGMAKEVARMVLPVNLYTQFYWSVNARSLMNFLSLRLAPTAQREIRDFADAVGVYFAERMPVTAMAWIDNGRIAP